MSFPTFPHLPQPFPHLSISPENLPHPHLLRGCGGVGGDRGNVPTFPHLCGIGCSRKGGVSCA
jgi:hypothetical protein